MTEKILVLGATGLVGQTLLRVMEERNFPSLWENPQFFFFASEKSEGGRIFFQNKGYEIQGMDKALDLAENGLVFFCGEEDKALELVPKLKEKATVIDNSPAFRLEPDVPLIVPEINSERIKDHKNLIANPNCTTIQLVLALFPLTKIYHLERVILSSYQSVSGAGRDALTEFLYETEFLVMRQKIERAEDSPFPCLIGDNLIPQIGSFDEKGMSREERKVREETRKILELPELKISATCVRVPITLGHSISLYCEFQEKVKIEDVYTCLEKEEYLFLHRDGYPTPADVRGKDLVHIGRIRVDEDNPKGLHLWVVADNLRRGAATNAVLIAEELIKENR
ncbi:MAG: aspartate-semialdehyde dehydrogenase [candidate division WOR-3 bacterium]